MGAGAEQGCININSYGSGVQSLAMEQRGRGGGGEGTKCEQCSEQRSMRHMRIASFG